MESQVPSRRLLHGQLRCQLRRQFRCQLHCSRRRRRVSWRLLHEELGLQLLPEYELSNVLAFLMLA